MSNCANATIELAPLKPGQRFVNWVAAAAHRLMASCASADAKLGEVLEALLDHPQLVERVLDLHAAAPHRRVGELLDDMAEGEFKNYKKKPKRKPNWPKFGAKDTVRAFTSAFNMEVQDSGADDEEARAAYVCALSGRPRTIATMKTTSDPGISFEDLAVYLIRTLESNETDADLQMLDAMVDRPGQNTQDYGEELLEESTRILSAHGYNDEQIRARAKQVFVRNLRGPVGDKLRNLFPETWEKALALARNIESALAAAPPTLAAAAPGATATSSSTFAPGQRSAPQGPKKDKSKDVCSYCKKVGHWKRDCKKLMAKRAAEEEAKQAKNGQGGSGPPK